MSVHKSEKARQAELFPTVRGAPRLAASTVQAADRRAPQDAAPTCPRCGLHPLLCNCPNPRHCPTCHAHINYCQCPPPRLRHSGFCACGQQILTCECREKQTAAQKCPRCAQHRLAATCTHIREHEEQTP